MKFKIGAKDTKILSIMEMDARRTSSGIGKSVKLSRELVNYRIKKLEENKIIEGYYPVLNVFNLGYIYLHLWLKLSDNTNEDDKKIIEYLCSLRQSSWVYLLEAEWDIMVTLFCRDLKDFVDVQRKIIEKFGRIIKERTSSIVINVSHFKSNFLYENYDPREISISINDKYLTINRKDKEIINILRKDCRINLAKLSQLVGLSPNGIKYRLTNLEDKLIVAYCTQINYPLLNYSVFRILMNFQKLDETKISGFIRYVKNLKHCIYTAQTIGKYDFEAEFIVKNQYEFYNLIKDIKKKFSELIRDYDYTLIHKEIKADYYL